MASLFRLQLLGPVQLDRDGEPLHGFKSRKAMALLCYLAAENRPVSRSYLVELFWPDQPETRGRNNLSQALHNIQGLWPGCFEANHHTVQFSGPASMGLDVKVFTELEARAEVNAWVMAIELYRGEFMSGMYLDDCPEFEQWLRLQQENWRQRVIQVLRNLIAHYTSHNEVEPALRYTGRLLEIDPGEEEGHRQKMILLARSSQRSAALAQFEACRRYLSEELGVDPARETVQLYEQIRANQFCPDAAPLTPPEILPAHLSLAAGPVPLLYNNLPAQSTSFIGREKELDLIEQYLTNPACRLLTLIGLGGIGKTRLALQAAAAAERFRHGVCFIPFSSTSSTEFLLPTMAEALNFPLYGRGDPKTQLIAYLYDKHMLLVLDNFEHLIGGAGLLVDILQRAPQIKMLVTSRERLNLKEEWVLHLQGLPFPHSDDSDRLANYSAVQLFLQRAQQVQADFWLRFLDKPAIARICWLVEGLPLGIELAAAWTRTFSCQEIATEIEKNYNFLTTSFQNVPQRHQSLQAVFEHSWKLLSDEEKKVFRKLSIFRRGFSRKSAERVAGASPVLLSALVDKSLLRWAAPDRFEMHELLRQYGTKKLVEDPREKEKVHFLHCKHYAAFLKEQEVRLKAGHQKEALAIISAEIENVRAGWQWAISHRREKEIEQYLEGLYFFYNMQSRFQEGEAVFRQAAVSLRKISSNAAVPAETTNKILGQVLARQGLFCAHLGDYEQARTLLQEALSLFQNPQIRRQVPLSLNYLGAIALALGEYAQAKQLCQECLFIARQKGDRWKEALALEYLGLLAINVSDYGEAEQLAKKSLAIFKDFGYRSGMAGLLNILGIVANDMGEYALAQQRCRHSLQLAREAGDQWEEALSLEFLSRIALSQGEYIQAQELARQSLAIYRKFDYSSGIALSLNILGCAARNLGQYREAKKLHQEMLQTCQNLNYPLGITLASYSLGYLAFLLRDYTEAKHLLNKSLELARRLTYQHGIARTLNLMGTVACTLGEYREAEKYLHEALKMAQKIQAIPMALDILTNLAKLLLAENRTEQVVELLAFTLNHAASKKETRDRAGRLWAELAAKLPQPMLATAQEKSQTAQLATLVAKLLGKPVNEDLMMAY